MTVELREITPEMHAEQVLPLSTSFWRGRRDDETYVRQTLEIARSAYGKRHYRLFGLYDGDALAATFKRYTRTLHFGGERLQAYGIGAVFTPPALRGRGYASAMLAAALDEWRAAGVDIGYLFSDIRPPFYEEIGFVTLPSRSISLRADTLASARVAVEPLQTKDWPALARCHLAIDRKRPWGFERGALVWNWIKQRMAHGSEHVTGNETNLVVRRSGSVAAYALGVRAPEHDAFVLDEYGYASEGDADLIGPLLRAAAGDLRRVTGWLPPDGWRRLLPRGAVRNRKAAIFMAAPLSAAARRWIALARAESAADGVWAVDHV